MIKKSSGTLLVEQEVERFGPMSFSNFVDIALYHPQYGYYNQSAPQRGRSGDYFTSLQVSSLFPEILAEAVIQMRESLDSDQFTFIEFGSGGGELIEGLLIALQKRKEMKGMRVISVERSRSAREKLLRKLSRFPKCQVVSSLDEVDLVGSLEGCIFSNEFFDAFPFRRLRFHQSGWVEIHVALKDGELEEKEIPLSDQKVISDFGLDKLEFEEGQEIEVKPQVRDWYKSIGEIFSRGFVVSFDYGYPREALYSPRRMKGTWLCYHKHETNQAPLANIGQQDITSHIDFTQLVDGGREFGFSPSLFSSQGIFLSSLGSKHIQDYLSAATEQDQRQRTGVVQQLIHPDAMGEAFWVLVQTKEAALPPAFQSISSRLRRLV